MNIGILGGSFNPPHIGHSIAAREVLAFSDIEEIWLMPCFSHSFEKPLAPVSDRLAMTQFLETETIQVSKLEIDNQLSGQTIDLVPHLKKSYPDDSFTFLMGSDQLLSFTKWNEWERLLRALPFLVIPRAGYHSQQLYSGMKLLENELLTVTNISSTLVRARMQKGLPVDHLVSKEVLGYIERHYLYQKSNIKK